MNDYEFIYTKLRKDFGKHCGFDDTDLKPLGHVDYSAEAYENYVTMNPVVFKFTNTAEQAAHSVNTKRIPVANRGQLHVEGGWPKEIDYSESQDTTKWRKRLDKDPAFTTAVKSLTGEVSQYLLQNKTIDVFEDYFAGESVTHQPHSLTTSTVAVFKDPVAEIDARNVTKISWHPDGPHRFVASYSILKFQRMDDNIPKDSFVWDVENPNAPSAELKSPTSPIVCAAYQPKNVDLIGAGLYNGLVVCYDLRSGGGGVAGHKPVAKSLFDTSHYDPVYELVWLQSKTQSECVTVSTDAKVLWWDVRNLAAPIDECELNTGDKEGAKRMGGTAIEWSQEAGPTKYLVGTEQGAVLALNKKPKKAVEIAQWYGLESKGGIQRHYGPVYSVKRNMVHCKFFMTVGDWCAKIWLEELKSPLIQTASAPSYLTCGGWSPTRAGVFYTCRQDGFMDIYDYFYRMNEVAYTHKVSDLALMTAQMQNQGKLCAVGDAGGTVTLLGLCDELWNPTHGEKNAIGLTFDREMRREKNLDAIKKAQARGGAADDDANGGTSLDEGRYISREKEWHKSLGIVAEAKDFTIPFGGDP